MSARPRLLRVLLSSILAMGVVGSVPAPAHAGVTTLCKGYQACSKAGMSASGYAKAGKTMYWRMYAGHNCTNYAAYRMVQSGMPNVRPWSGGGNATYWGTSMASITDQTPTVGSVAWWKAGVYPAGSAGHVAYVEEVVSANEIIISQDSWGGDFSWARVTRGRGWPSGFIHFNDVPLRNVTKPALSGVAKVGGELVAQPGSWAPQDVSTEYRWLVDGNRLRSASGPRLTLDESLLGRKIKVRVVASRPGFPTAKAASKATPAVLPGELSIAEQPQVDGEPTVDSQLSLNPGRWSPAPDAVARTWRVDGKRVAAGDSLALTPDMAGRTVTAEVTASRAGYEPVTVTAAKLVVAPGTLQLRGEPRMKGGTRPGEVLVVRGLGASPKPEARVRWLRDGREIPGASTKRYTLTEEDLGSRVTSEVTLRRPGYRPITRTFASAKVRAETRLAVRTERVGRKLRVTARLRGEHVGTVDGVVRFVVQGTEVKQKRLSDGIATFTVRKAPPTPLRVKAVHPRTATTEKAVRVVRAAAL